MDINSIPDAFQSKIRLAIVSSLLSGAKTFNELKELIDASDGNLSVHLTKLEKMKYLDVQKDFLGKKPRTTYILSELGRTDFKAYVRLLEFLITQSK